MTIDVMMIRGAPASGKSTAASALRDELRRGAVIEVDQLRALAIHVDWTDQAIHAAALGMAIDGAIRLVGAGVRPVVIVDTFAWSSLPGAQERLDAADLRHVTLTLWVRRGVLERRLAGRRTGYRCSAGALAVNAEMLAGRVAGEVFVDASDLEPMEVMRLAVAMVGAGDILRVGNTDLRIVD